MRFQKDTFVGAVTALRFSADGSLLYAAVGCTLYVYDSARGTICTAPLDVWSQGTIHGMDMGVSSAAGALALCFGQKQVALLQNVAQTPSEAAVAVHGDAIVAATECVDWVLDARLLLDEIVSTAVPLPPVAIGLAHNMIHVWDPNANTILHEFQCTERSILYAMGLYGRSLDSLVVAAGTVFQHILLWAPTDTTAPIAPAQRLHQHDGVLFQLEWSATGRTLASVSDDRSVQLWSNAHDDVEPTLAPRVSRDEALALRFQSRFRAWGHTARVWDVQFCHDGRLVSASEDATCKLWSATTGDCLATLVGHVDTNVWRVAVHPRRDVSVVATGGGDNAIKLWDVDQAIHAQSVAAARPFATMDGLSLRNMVALPSALYWISDQGHVGVQPIAEPVVAPVIVNVHANVCCVSGTTDVVAVGDVKGQLMLLTPTTLDTVAVVPLAHAGRIMSIWCLDDGVTIYTTGVDLKLREWRYHATALALVATYQCPSKTCMASLVTHDATLWCGDARGNICAFHRPSSSTSPDDIIQPYLVRVQVHGKDVVRPLDFSAASTSSSFERVSQVSSLAWHAGRLYSCGYDGYMCTLAVEKMSSSSAVPALVVRRRVAVKGISTLKTLSWTPSGDLVVFGFHASHGIVVNVTQNLRLLALDCGGWRRPHALHLDHATGGHVLGFALPKSSALHVHRSSVRTCSSLFRTPASWHGQHHSKMGCCIAAVGQHHVVTGSEDGSLKLHPVASSSSIRCVDTVSMHVTNVRALNVVGDWVVSGGGKQSIHLWRATDAALDHMAEYTPTNVSQDQRILALAATAIDDETLAVFATNSEGQLTFLTARADSGLTMRATWSDSDKPILSCAVGLGFLVTGATDGHVVVWDVAALLGQLTDDVVAPTAPVYKYRAHDMGANCICLRPTGAASFDVLSGGDDQCIAHAAVVFDRDAATSLQVRHLPGVQNASASALKTIQSLGDVVVAAGYDQRVTAWHVDNAAGTLTWASAAFSEVADIAGVALRPSTTKNATQVVVVGKGMQTMTLHHAK
ncbi:Aste57867_25178 [Aphanomyces stellatus]|uniref:Aste57867_25178 protein n=1 Tax=Aphanomyces stellatus TaxID=120398 RepID=A0A485LTU1_9STRA|nr:hypothetical protein As57867_025100 [Aphanomyces stellatus]VFU01807.1 Aste57867_25178 [Aphanomyces stellatus]